MGAGKGKKRLVAVGKGSCLAFCLALSGSFPQVVLAQFSTAPPPPPVTPVAPVIPVTPPPVFQPPVILPVRDFNPPLIPTDYTGPTRFREEIPLPQMPSSQATGGVKKLTPEAFLLPEGEEANGILVRAKDGSRYTRPSLKSVQLEEGSLLVSVRRPCDRGLVTTPHASVAIAAGSDVIVEYREGVLRVFNLTGIGEAVKVQIHATSVSARLVNADTPLNEREAEKTAAPPAPAFTFALKLSHEIVFADRPLTQGDLHPADGIARRGVALLESNMLAVSEFSLESVINSCDMILELQEAVSGVRERRLLGDMAKMAAVLNHVNGTQGFVAYRNEKSKN